MAVIAKDPVCGMTPKPETPHRFARAGDEVLFCSAGCKAKFEADPARYAHGANPHWLGPGAAAAHAHHAPAPPPQHAPPGAQWTCPMHPEIVRDGPGACPICGMALEPTTPSADAGPNPELADMRRRFVLGAALAAPIVALEMGGHLGVDRLVPAAFNAPLQLLLATPVVLWAGWPFFARGWASLRTRALNMFTLIALGVGAAWLYSLAATLAPGAFPAALRTPHGAPPVYFEAAAVITVLALLGQVLELQARERTGGAIRALLDLAPKTARRIRADGVDEEIALDAVAVGDRLRVRPGEKAPVDAIVLDGRSNFDESLITGESMPVARGPGDRVIAGALNQTGALIIRAERVGRETMLAQIVRMVADAQRSRAPIQRGADRVAGWIVPAVIAVAALAFAAWMLAGPAPRFSFALIAAVSVL
ncbi:MAG: HAD-IC family P-type ATPase, partial [Hyphomonadaceae bacterium]